MGTGLELNGFADKDDSRAAIRHFCESGRQLSECFLSVVTFATSRPKYCFLICHILHCEQSHLSAGGGGGWGGRRVNE